MNFLSADGVLQGAHSVSSIEPCLTHSDPYVPGWLSTVEGETESGTLEV